MDPTPAALHADRDLRQRGLVPPEQLAECHAVVIGVGAIGRQVALQLATVGVPWLTLYDDDHVGAENLAAQGYCLRDLGAPKVLATEALCRQINPQIQVAPVAVRFRRSTASHLRGPGRLVMFACVDSIAVRRLLWESLRCRAALFVDGRMSAEVVRVLAVDNPIADDYYATTLFEAAEAYAGPCTARSTIYTASIAAGLMVGQLAKWLRRIPLDADVTLNLLAMELAIAAPVTA
jgi:sulfur carrier protein ThiS adenylyltransferase